MKKEFCTYEQSLALKELRFDEPCWAWWHIEDCDTRFCYSEQRSPIINSRETEVVGLPTYSAAFRWFREKHNLRGFIGFRPNVKMFDCHVYDMSLSGKEYVKQRTMEEYNKDPLVGTYEEAESACIDKLIEIVKNK